MGNQKAILTVTVKHPKDGKEVIVKTIVPADAVKNSSNEETQRHIQEELKALVLEPQFAITQVQSVYSMVDLYEPFQFGDTMVEINLPYCLHLPQGFHVNIGRNNEVEARVEFTKAWTALAFGSSEADYFTKDVATYFQNGAITTPRMPHDPQAGWDVVSKATNAEKLMDRNGVYRYTILRVFIQTQTKEISHNEKTFKTLDGEIQKRCREIINRILDTYKFVTKEIHVERLPLLTITNVYFQNINAGYYPMPINIGSAMMNRSEDEIEQVKKMLKDDVRPPAHTRLFLSAQNSLHKQDGLLAVVEMYQAFEIFLENFLFERFKKQGKTDEEIGKKLDRFWKTKERLKELLKEAIGKSLQEIDKASWDKWCLLYDKCRNEVIHAAKEIEIMEASEALAINQKVVALIESQPSPDPISRPALLKGVEEI